MKNQITDNATLIQAIVEGAQEKKARSIATVDLSGIEYAPTQAFVIANGNTPIQVDAIADSIREYVENKLGVRPYNYDGYQNSQWIDLDYGTVYVHIFLPEFRTRYNLEQLWSDAPITTIPDLD